MEKEQAEKIYTALLKCWCSQNGMELEKLTLVEKKEEKIA